MPKTKQFIIPTKAIVEYEIKKSRFIGIVLPITKQSLQKELHQIASTYPDANHLCYAWRCYDENKVLQTRFNDGGEPSGTAGKPILAHLQGQGLINCMVIVVRYFGGIKLGAGGLTRAYGQATKDVLVKAEIKPYIPMARLKLELDYAQMPQFEYQCKQFDVVVLKQDFTEKINIEIELPENELESFEKIFNT